MDFEAVFNSLPTPTMVMDTDFNIVAMNQAYLDVTGRTRENLVGLNVFMAFPAEGESRRALQDSFERVRDHGVADVLPALRYPIAGENGVVPRSWNCTHVPIHGADGKVAFLVQNTQEVSASKNEARKAEGNSASCARQRLEMIEALNLALLASADHLHRLFMTASNVMCVLRGPQHVFEMANTAWRGLAGGRDVIGKPVREALPELAGQGYFELMDEVLASGQPFASRRMRLMLPNCEGWIDERFLDLTFQPIIGDAGGVRGVFVEGVDVTESVRAEDRQALFIRELHHRVRNTLATVQGVMNSTAKSSATIEEFQEAFAGRIGSLAKTHAVLTEELDQSVSFEHLLNQELGFYADELGERIRLRGPAVDLPSQIAVPLGMAVHELTTNAAKYGALASDAGRIVVEWSLAECRGGAALKCEWNESDGPVVTPPAREGFGSMLLKRVLSQQIGADVNVAFEPEGFRLKMLVPIRSER